MFGGRSGPKKHFGGTWSRVLPAFKPQYMQMEALRLTRSKRADEEAKRQIGIRVTAFGSQPPASSPARRCRPSRELAGERTRRACRVPRPRGTPEAALPTTTLAFSRASPDPRGRGFGTRGARVLPGVVGRVAPRAPPLRNRSRAGRKIQSLGVATALVLPSASTLKGLQPSVERVRVRLQPLQGWEKIAGHFPG